MLLVNPKPEAVGQNVGRFRNCPYICGVKGSSRERCFAAPNFK
jgi:hypothetical protein